MDLPIFEGVQSRSHLCCMRRGVPTSDRVIVQHTRHDPEMNSFDAAFGQVFALATLTCQNAVHSVFRNTGAFWFVPFYKLRAPLKSLVDRTRDLDSRQSPPSSLPRRLPLDVVCSCM